MSYADRASPAERSIDDAVATAFLVFDANDIVSTRTIIDLTRRALGATPISDEEIVSRIVGMATGRTMPVVFDHRQG